MKKSRKLITASLIVLICLFVGFLQGCSNREDNFIKQEEPIVEIQEVARLTSEKELGIGISEPQYDIDIFNMETGERVGFANYDKANDKFIWIIMDTVETLEAIQLMLEGMVRQKAN